MFDLGQNHSCTVGMEKKKFITPPYTSLCLITPKRESPLGRGWDVSHILITPQGTQGRDLTCQGHQYVGLALNCLSLPQVMVQLLASLDIKLCFVLMHIAVERFPQVLFKAEHYTFPFKYPEPSCNSCQHYYIFLFLKIYLQFLFSALQPLPTSVLFCSWTFAPGANEVCTGLNLLRSFKGRFSY